MRKILFILVLLLSQFALGQYSYSYIDPCSGRTKSIFIPAGQNNITVNYYGNVNVFNSNDFNNGTFYSWVTSVSQANSSSPCSEIITTLTNNVNMIVTQNVITVTTNVLSIADMAFSLADINSLSGSVPGLAEAINNSEDSEEEKKNKQNGQSTTSNGIPNSGNVLSNNSSGSNLSNTTNSQITQEKISLPNGTTNGNSAGDSKAVNVNGSTTGGSNSASSEISNEKSQPTSRENSSTKNSGSSNGQSNEASQTGISQKENPSGINSISNSQTTNASIPTNSGLTKNVNNQNSNQPINSSNMDSSTELNTNSNNNSNPTNKNDQPGSESTSSNSNINTQSSNNEGVNSNLVNSSTNKTTSNPGGFGQTSIAISNAEENSGDSEKKTGSMIGTGDLVVMKSAEDPNTANQYRFNASLTHANTNNTRIKGVLGNYTTGINNTNVTFYKAWVFKKSKLTAIAANSSMMNFERDFFNTTTLVVSKRYKGNWKKLTTMLGLNLTAGNYGETRFINASAMAGGFYSYRISKKISGSTLLIGVYSPFTQFFDGRWWDSSTLLVPYSTWDYSITKTFKLNVSFSGVYEMNKNMLNYQVMTGGKILF